MKALKRPDGATPIGPDHPYSAVYWAARNEWTERWGDYVTARNHWRRACFAALAIAGLTTWGFVTERSRNHVVPYVVAVDHLGDAVAVGRADAALPADPRIIRAQLANWIANVRSVYVDGAAERKFILQAYAMTDRNGPAITTLNDWFSQHDPFGRAKTATVTVDVLGVVEQTRATWLVQWREQVVNRDGTLAGAPEYWEATAEVKIVPPADDASVMANPAGVWVEDFHWTRRAGA